MNKFLQQTGYGKIKLYDDKKSLENKEALAKSVFSSSEADKLKPLPRPKSKSYIKKYILKGHNIPSGTSTSITTNILPKLPNIEEMKNESIVDLDLLKIKADNKLLNLRANKHKLTEPKNQNMIKLKIKQNDSKLLIMESKKDEPSMGTLSAAIQEADSKLTQSLDLKQKSSIIRIKSRNGNLSENSLKKYSTKDFLIKNGKLLSSSQFSSTKAVISELGLLKDPTKKLSSSTVKNKESLIRKSNSISNITTLSYIQKEEPNVEKSFEDIAINSHHNVFLKWYEIEQKLFGNKDTLLDLIKDYLTVTNDEFIKKQNLNISMFHLNKSSEKLYHKALMLQLVVLIYIDFVISDFYSVEGILNKLQEIIFSLSCCHAIVFENFFMKKLERKNNSSAELYQTVLNILNKSQGIKKGKSMEIFNNLTKCLDNAMTLLKNFSSNFIRGGLFIIHQVGTNLMQSIASYSYNKTFKFVTENVLFGIIEPDYSFNETSKVDGYGSKFELNSVLNSMPPFLPPDIRCNNNYTLILDLDETLVHHFETPSGGSFLIRPGAFQFISKMASLFEVIIFTAGTKDYADNILSFLDKDRKYISHRLYRQHTTNTGFKTTKDLALLGRDLSKVIFIDNIEDNFSFQPNNGLLIETWTNDLKDTQLMNLERLLEDLYSLKLKDVRCLIKGIKEEVNKKLEKNNSNPYAKIDCKSILFGENK